MAFWGPPGTKKWCLGSSNSFWAPRTSKSQIVFPRKTKNMFFFSEYESQRHTSFKVLAPGGSGVFHKISDVSPILHNSPSNVLPKVVTVGLNLRNAFPRFNLTAVMLLLTTQLLIKLINSDIDKPGIYMGFSLFRPVPDLCGSTRRESRASNSIIRTNFWSRFFFK